MQRFKKLMESEGFVFVTESDVKPAEAKTLDTKFDVILNALLTDILEKKSKSFRTMLSKGMKFDFSKAVEFPKEPIQMHYLDLIREYKEDMQ
ncbi:MAG: hypothetical protein WB791_04450 [Waddliaceae bacterium]